MAKTLKRFKKSTQQFLAMKTDRRKFLKTSGLTGIGLAGAGIIRSYAAINKEAEKTKNTPSTSICVAMRRQSWRPCVLVLSD
jgi:hypothetical protein